MLELLNNFSTLDLVLIAVISLIASMMLRRWYALAWIVMVALAADFALPLLYVLATGAGWDASWDSATARFVHKDGGILILRTAAYFALIGAVFGIKVAWRKR